MPILHQGRVTATDFIVEPVVYGQHPFSEEERVAATLDLFPGLVQAWRRSGPVDAPLADVMAARQLRRLAEVLADAAVEGARSIRERRRLVRRTRRLARRNLQLPCAPTHGDMVATNIIRQASGRHVLVDWEHGRQMPVAFDVAKLILMSGRPLEMHRRLEPDLGDFGLGSGQQFDRERDLQITLLAGLLAG